ncbi:MAG: pilus assembly PilX N-terminal domain-containing protein [Patescibacteria group bacterium]
MNKTKNIKLKKMFRGFWNNQRAFVSVMALLLSNIFLILGMSVFSIALRESILSSGAKESLAAFYAADGGIECALYWDIKGEVFSTSTPAVKINCARQDITVSFSSCGEGCGKNVFEILFAPNPNDGEAYTFPCAQVEVKKEGAGTFIKSYGRNTCDEGNVRRVERAWSVVY